LLVSLKLLLLLRRVSNRGALLQRRPDGGRAMRRRHSNNWRVLLDTRIRVSDNDFFVIAGNITS
jgi:hypothetical protein